LPKKIDIAQKSKRIKKVQFIIFLGKTPLQAVVFLMEDQQETMDFKWGKGKFKKSSKRTWWTSIE
jgi:hypothetical protein